MVQQAPRFKTRHLSPHALLTKLFPNLNYIWIMRRDKVRQTVSLWKGLQTLYCWKKTGDPLLELDKDLEYNLDKIDYFVALSKCFIDQNHC